ncbi:MAG: 4Fe-4S dicluster domain-containing protein [Clostridiaceae bacterium]|nr:4Fe-4S dicluster domain-containing protein [Clostridiaceae bacterium]
MSRLHSVKLNRDLCVGCTTCIKRCPTEAIRVRNGKAQIAENRCIDCGECIRVCPHHAKSAVMDTLDDLKGTAFNVALAAPSLYAQFGPPATRGMVLAALGLLGFDAVYEVAQGAEIVTASTAAFVQKALEEGRRPLISSACPVVVRLIQMRFPGLVENLVPFDSPMEVTADLARRQLAEKTGLPQEKIGVFFISPCPAKRTAVINPIARASSAVNGVIAISDLYPQILAGLEKMDAKTALQEGERLLTAGSTGVRWAYTGGEAIALHMERYLAVDGIHNVIEILEEVENERLHDVDFIEANACLGGCIGGPLTVANRFSAHARQRAFVSRAPEEARQGPQTAPDLPLESWKELPLPNPAMQLDEDIVQAMQKYEQLKQIVAGLPGLDCGACGAPDCEALAEDIVRGEAAETDCIFKLKERIRAVAAVMSDLGEEMNRYAPNREEDPHDTP